MKIVKLSVVLCLLLVGLTGCGVNTIPTLDEQVSAAWAQVQNQYQRRMDLIPNLVETVKGYAKFEQSTLVEVTQARADATKVTLTTDQLSDPAAVQKFEQAQGTVTSALSHLLVASERYPDLKADQQFLTLEAQIEGTENRIAVARRDYITAVQAYNVEVRTFPGRLWASLYSAKPKVEFTASDGADKAPVVKF